MRRFTVLAAALTMLTAPAFAADGDDTAPAAAPPAAATDTATDTDNDQGPLDDAAFDARFQCPETYRDADARIEEFQRYVDWTREVHPDWNFRKRLDVRYGLLRRHACTATLQNIAASGH